MQCKCEFKRPLLYQKRPQRNRSSGCQVVIAQKRYRFSRKNKTITPEIGSDTFVFRLIALKISEKNEYRICAC